MPVMSKQPKKPVGEPIDWTEEDIDKLAEITLEDITSAKAHWNRVAPKKLKKVLDAKAEEEE